MFLPDHSHSDHGGMGLREYLGAGGRARGRGLSLRLGRGGPRHRLAPGKTCGRKLCAHHTGRGRAYIVVAHARAHPRIQTTLDLKMLWEGRGSIPVIPQRHPRGFEGSVHAFAFSYPSRTSEERWGARIVSQSGGPRQPSRAARAGGRGGRTHSMDSQENIACVYREVFWENVHPVADLCKHHTEPPSPRVSYHTPTQFLNPS